MKYLILNDFCYLIKKRKFFILLLFVIPLIVTILNAKSSMKSLEIFFLATGTNVNLNELNVLEILMLLFSTFSFLFIYIDIYLKDLDKNLENIFLRINSKKYISKKIILSMLITFMLKFIQYVIITITLLLFNHFSLEFNILKLFFIDFLYTISMQLIFLLIYMIFIIMKKKVYYLTISIMLSIILIPKNIWQTKKYVVIVFLVIITLSSLIKIIFSRRASNIIENI